MKFWNLGLAFLVVLLLATTAFSQTDIHISGAATGFPIAVPRLCDAGSGAPLNSELANKVASNLQFSGLFRVLNADSYVETPGKCLAPDQVAFSDWSIIGAEGLVRGEVQSLGGDKYEVRFYLYDVQQKRAVVGKKYEFASADYQRVANRFSNEIIKAFTGELGIFGTKIVYVSKIGRFKDLFVMDVDGSNVRQITRDRGLAISPSWVPDGQKIIYTSYRSRQPELYYVSAEGGAPTQITNRPGLELGAKFSPDGRSFIAAVSSDGDTHLSIFEPRGRLIKDITRGGAIDVSASWSPDGTEIVMCSNRAGGPQIYRMSTDGGPAVRVSHTGSNYCTSPAWSPKGDKIAFVCLSGGTQIFISDPDGKDIKQITYNGQNEDPAWSPDGRYIAFASTFGVGKTKNIAIYSLFSGQTMQVTHAKNDNSQPSWSPRQD